MTRALDPPCTDHDRNDPADLAGHVAHIADTASLHDDERESLDEAAAWLRARARPQTPGCPRINVVFGPGANQDLVANVTHALIGWLGQGGVTDANVWVDTYRASDDG